MSQDVLDQSPSLSEPPLNDIDIVGLVEIGTRAANRENAAWRKSEFSWHTDPYGTLVPCKLCDFALSELQRIVGC